MDQKKTYYKRKNGFDRHAPENISALHGHLQQHPDLSVFLMAVQSDSMILEKNQYILYSILTSDDDARCKQLPSRKESKRCKLWTVWFVSKILGRGKKRTEILTYR
jgi:hypothetical protein